MRQSKVAKKILRYLPFIKRIQRLYLSEETAKQMTWHKKGKRYEDENGRINMGHPSDGKAWKNFDAKHPDEVADARNVRVAIATDMDSIHMACRLPRTAAGPCLLFRSISLPES